MKSSSLGGDAVKLSATRIVTSLVALVTAMLLSRFLSLGEYGAYSQLLLVGNLAAAIFMLGLPGSINYFLGKTSDPTERRAFLSAYYSLTGALGVLCGLVLVLSVPILEDYFGNPALGSFLYFFATFPWARITSSSFDSVLIVHRRLGSLFYFRIINAAYLLGIVVATEILHLGFAGYMILFVVGECGFALAVYALCGTVVGRLRLSLDLKVYKRILSYSVPLGLASATGLLSAQLDKLLIGLKFQQEYFAIYANASKELPVAIISTSITAVLLPVLSRMLAGNHVREAVSLWSNGILIGFCTVGLFATGLFTFAPGALTLLYSEPYAAGAPIFRVYCVMMILRSTYFGMLLSASGSTGSIYWTSLASLVIGFSLGWFLLSHIGALGPAVGSLIALAATQLLQLLFASRHTGISMARIFPWGGVTLILVANVLFAGLFAFLKEWLPFELLVGEVGEVLLLGVIWAALYFCTMARPLRRWYAKLKSPE